MVLGIYASLVNQILNGLVVDKLMQTVKLLLRLEQPTCIKVLICSYNLTNDETFNLWDTLN